MAYLSGITIRDGANLDAFSRLRTSNPEGVFDAQLTYNIPSLVFESVTNGSGAAVAHDATNRCATCTFSSTTTGGKAYLQSYEFCRYQPGKSQMAFVTFNFIEKVANCLKFAGYSDGTNGIELQQSGTTVQVALLSNTTNGNQTITQANWNLDPMDGTGPSGITLDLTKVQIFIIDFQALYVGRVRVGFDIDGSVVYVHDFLHANRIAYPYAANVNRPIRCGMTCTGTVSTTMRFVCCSVISEGGQEDVGAYSFSQEGTVTAGSGTRTHMLSLRPKTTFNSITNRIKFVLDSIDFIVTGNNPVLWDISIGQAISGTTTFADVNTNYFGFEFNTAGTLSGSPVVTVLQGYCNSTNQSRGTVSKNLSQKYPITLDAAGAVRANGTVTVSATGLGGTSACRVVLNWKEIR